MNETINKTRSRTKLLLLAAGIGAIACFAQAAAQQPSEPPKRPSGTYKAFANIVSRWRPPVGMSVHIKKAPAA